MITLIKFSISVGIFLSIDDLAAFDVGVNVEVAEEDQHDDHVAGQEILAPGREVTLAVE